MCPVGSEVPQGCPAGSYQNEEGQSTCKTCPAGMCFDAVFVCSSMSKFEREFVRWMYGAKISWH